MGLITVSESDSYGRPRTTVVSVVLFSARRSGTLRDGDVPSLDPWYVRYLGLSPVVIQSGAFCLFFTSPRYVSGAFVFVCVCVCMYFVSLWAGDQDGCDAELFVRMSQRSSHYVEEKSRQLWILILFKAVRSIDDA